MTQRSAHVLTALLVGALLPATAFASSSGKTGSSTGCNSCHGSTPSSNTTATFSAAGVYTLRLSATDGALDNADDVVVTVSAP